MTLHEADDDMKLALTLLIVVCSALSQAGCNVLGFAASSIAGDTKQPAAFTPAKRPTVVIAERFNHAADSTRDGEPIARYVSEELRRQDVAPIIDPDQVSRLQTQDPARYRGMTIAAVGQAVGAEQILYVDIVRVDVHFADNSDLIRGQGEVRVRFIDANTAQTIWPPNVAEGLSVTAETPIVRRAERYDALLRTDVHRALAAQVARLFYATKPE